MLGDINFPEGITWNIKYLNGYDMCGEGFSAINMYGAYKDLTAATVIDIKYDTSKSTSFGQAFYGCNSLILCPNINTSSATGMSYMFYTCRALRSIPQLDTSKVIDMSYMFNDCQNLRSIPLLDCSRLNVIDYMFGYSDIYSLTDLGGFKNLRVDFRNGLYYLPKLTVQSLMNVINNLYDFRANGSTTTKTLQLGTTNLNKLTDEQKAVATNKGWSLT